MDATPEELNAVKTMYENRDPLKQIADRLGCSVWKIQRLLEALSVPRRQSIRRMPREHFVIVRSLYKQGVLLKEIERRLGYNESTIKRELKLNNVPRRPKPINRNPRPRFQV